MYEHVPPVLDLVLDVLQHGTEERYELLCVSDVFPPPGNVELVIAEGSFVIVLDVVSAVDHGLNVLLPQYLQVSGSSLSS